MPFSRMQKISAALALCSVPNHPVIAGRLQPVSPFQSAAALKVRPDDAPTREGFEHFYNSDYDPAIQDFEKTQRAHPDDPFAANHLLEAVLVREIDREGDLNAELYLGTEFLHAKRMLVDTEVRTRIQELAKQALNLSDERLRTKPDDVDALYARGVTRSLSAIYEGLVEKAWYSAFRDALGAYNDHKRVLELAPSYSDAKLVVGVYSYIVAALPIYERVVAFMLSIKAGKAEGIESVRQAANAGGEASIDAKTSLSLFLAREHQYPEALSLMHELYGSYPHNFHYGLSEADLLRTSGKLPEAAVAYRDLLAMGERNTVAQSQLARAAINLGKTLHSQGNYRAAANAFESATQMTGADREHMARAKLLAGEMYDVLQERDAATRKYREVIATNEDSIEVRDARRFLKDPYHDP
ncbi:MAG TPA: tetratricopeptide repeat protein [Candidatus Acidoferrales bacterium]|jgi:tetratricopeptide (TPR) repeat protein|nr:tetratricopeptide repeat protein [Candidatus Acidoferrales bacterium]